MLLLVSWWLYPLPALLVSRAYFVWGLVSDSQAAEIFFSCRLIVMVCRCWCELSTAIFPLCSYIVF